MNPNSAKHPQYKAEAITDQTGIVDIRIHIAGKVLHMWGRNAVQREQALAQSVPQNVVPVLLGAGLGYCANQLLQHGFTVAIADTAPAIRELGEMPDDVLLLEGSVDEVIRKLRQISAETRKPLYPVKIPFYLRLDPNWYGSIAKAIETSLEPDFWQRMAYPRFQSAKPRILFMDADYFLSGEILTAMKRLDIPHVVLPVPKQGQPGNQYMESLLHSVLAFKPDFLLTVNHFGLDREGKITNLLQRMNLPLASWFVDNPHLILYRYAELDAPNIALFTYDAGNMVQMRNRGFANVYHLPLATDPHRFHPDSGPGRRAWQSEVSFVGNSMRTAVQNALRQTGMKQSLEPIYRAVARDFARSKKKSVAEFLEQTYPDTAQQLNRKNSLEQQLAVESLITWEATRQYRLSCVKETLRFAPLIVGDHGWKEQLESTESWRHLQRLDYYTDLPRFYPCTTINFNCTSLQMKGAVNQRVFDVPATGAFVLTDQREQLDNLFEPGTECVTYRTSEEIPGLIEQYLADTPRRNAIVTAARSRILAEHTYVHRMKTLCSTMRQTFA